MQTNITPQFLDTPEGREANDILRSCVHCGFCTATCPTYQLLSDELDGPRGRIYLIKQVLEGKQASKKTQLHLDRCLTCRSCETTCPSGVRYGRLVDIGRDIVEKQVTRSPIERLQRYALRKTLPYPKFIKPFLRTGQLLKPLLPQPLKKKIPSKQQKTHWPSTNHSRQMLVLAGCIQSVATPKTNSATAEVLNKLGITLIEEKKSGCCGAVSHHLTAQSEGHDFMRRNIDAWWPYIEQGIEAIIITASGCSVVVKDYGEILKNDPHYADKAQRVSALTKDISEVINDENITDYLNSEKRATISFHSPCTLQHGQKLDGVVESILQQAGYTLLPVTDAHLCCGSAGTYSILQSKLSQQLLDKKLTALEHHQPDFIATANIGCQLHLETQSKMPVKHWIELLNSAM